MASLEQCQQAITAVLAELENGSLTNTADLPDRSLSCLVTDLEVVFCTQLQQGKIGQITTIDPDTAATAPAQIRLSTTSDDLIALASKQLSLPAAWASGRVSIKANLFDLMKLRALA